MNVKKKIKHIVRWFTPYGVVRWYRQRQHVSIEMPKETFMNSYRKYLNSGQRVEFAEQSPFKTVVSVQGFGYSGSGAVVDLLREYDSTIVVGNVDSEGSVTAENIRCAEVDILRLAGGLFEVEKYIGSNNIFQNDALLHRIIAQIENSEIFMEYEETRPYFYEYLRSICQVLTNYPQVQFYNTYLDYKGKNDIFYLKEITLDEYRTICRRLLNTLFSIIKGNSSASILVLDQFVGDVEFDVKKYRDYIPNLKMIIVYRDPRDVYTFANHDDIGWIPHNSVDDFIEWYSILTKHYNLNENKEYLTIQFEQLITNYEEVVSIIENYVGLNDTLHTRKLANLNPSVSYKNLFIWERSSIKRDAFEKIYKTLMLYCYKK
jgi:hypothetical protein